MRFLPDIEVNETDAVFAIDKKDISILKELALNARQSLAQLSKKTKLSRDVVSYRLAQYKKNSFLHNARMLFDVGYLGYDSYHIFMRLITPISSSDYQLIHKITAHPHVRAVLHFYGAFDLEIAVIAKSIQQFDAILLEIIEIMQSQLLEYEVVAITQNIIARSFPLSFVKQEQFVDKKTKKIQLDDIDFAIIKEMRDNADRPLVSISQKIGISADVLVYRLRNLEQSIILGYAPVINYGAIGFSVTAVLCAVSGLTTKKQQMITQLLKTDQNILWAVKIFGRYNLLFYVCSKTQKQYHETINRLREALGDQLHSIESLSAVAEYKYTLAPDCLFENQKSSPKKKIYKVKLKGKDI